MKSKIRLVTILVIALSLSAMNLFGSRSLWRLTKEEVYTDYAQLGELQLNYQTNYYYNLTHPARVDSSFQIPTNDNLMPTLRYFYYSESGNNLVSYFDVVSPIDCSHAHVRTYDNQNRIIMEEIYGGGWQSNPLKGRGIYEYDNNRLTRAIYTNNPSQPDSSSYSRTTYEHDGQGRIVNSTEENSFGLNNWYVYGIGDYAYLPADTSNGLDYIDYISHWERYIGKVINSLTGLVSHYAIHENQQNEAWQWIHDYQYIYNDNGRLAEILYTYTYSIFGGQEIQKDIYTYDVFGNLCEISCQNWHAESLTWSAPSSVTKYFWEQYTDGNDGEEQVVDIQMYTYPNPFKESIRITLLINNKYPAHYKIYNNKGQLVKSYNSDTKSVNWDGKDNNNRKVASGVYIVQANVAGKAVTKKVIKIQ